MIQLASRSGSSGRGPASSGSIVSRGRGASSGGFGGSRRTGFELAADGFRFAEVPFEAARFRAAFADALFFPPAEPDLAPLFRVDFFALVFFGGELFLPAPAFFAAPAFFVPVLLPAAFFFAERDRVGFFLVAAFFGADFAFADVFFFPAVDFCFAEALFLGAAFFRDAVFFGVVDLRLLAVFFDFPEDGLLAAEVFLDPLPDFVVFCGARDFAFFAPDFLLAAIRFRFVPGESFHPNFGRDYNTCGGEVSERRWNNVDFCGSSW